MNESTVSIEDAKRQVELTSRRLGLLHLAFAEVLVRDLGPTKGRLLIARAIKEYSLKIAAEKKDRAQEQGIELTEENFMKLSDLPRFGMHEAIEEVEVEGEKRIRAHGCVMGKVWREHEGDALGRYYCFVDPASSMAFNPDFKLVHTKALPDGDPFCELVIRRTTEEDRREFSAKDTHWKSIEEDEEKKNPTRWPKGAKEE
jgi:hypothetical protein